LRRIQCKTEQNDGEDFRRGSRPAVPTTGSVSRATTMISIGMIMRTTIAAKAVDTTSATGVRDLSPMTGSVVPPRLFTHRLGQAPWVLEIGAEEVDPAGTSTPVRGVPTSRPTWIMDRMSTQVAPKGHVTPCPTPRARRIPAFATKEGVAPTGEKGRNP